MIPSTILSVGILLCPFSPRWLLSHDREDEALDVLMKIRSASHDEIEEELDRIKKEIIYLRENEINSYCQLLQKPLLRPFLLGIGIQILQQITGINATIYYAPQIFTLLCNSTSHSSFCNMVDPPLLMTGIYGLVNVVATIPTMIFIDKLGRRRLLISGATIMSTSLFIVYILWKVQDESVAILIFIYIFVFGFALSWGPIPWVYCTEIFPLTMRAKATSFTTAVNWITNCIVSFSVSLGISTVKSQTFLIFAIICGLMIIIVYFFYPETKNIPLEEQSITADNRIFVPVWLEKRRTNYNSFSSPQPIQRRFINDSSLGISSSTNNQVNEERPPKIID